MASLPAQPVFLTYVAPQQSSAALAPTFLQTDVAELAAATAPQPHLLPCLAPALAASIAAAPTTVPPPRHVFLASSAPLVLQVVDAVDVTRSLADRVKGATAVEGGVLGSGSSTAGAGSNGAGASPSANGSGGAAAAAPRRGMAKLLLTDGFTSIVALELTPCAALNNLSIGAKIVISNGKGHTRLLNTAVSSLSQQQAPQQGAPPIAPSSLVLLLAPSSVLHVRGAVPLLAALHRERMALTAHKLTGRPMLSAGGAGGAGVADVGITPSQEDLLASGAGGGGHHGGGLSDDDPNMFLTIASRAGGGGAMAPSAVATAAAAAARPARTMLSFGGGGGAAPQPSPALTSVPVTNATPHPSPPQHQHHPPSILLYGQPPQPPPPPAQPFVQPPQPPPQPFYAEPLHPQQQHQHQHPSLRPPVPDVFAIDDDDDDAYSDNPNAPPLRGAGHTAGPDPSRGSGSGGAADPHPQTYGGHQHPQPIMAGADPTVAAKEEPAWLPSQRPSTNLPNPSASSAPYTMATCYGRLEELVSELTVVRLGGGGAYGCPDGTVAGAEGYELLAAVRVASAAEIAPNGPASALAPYLTEFARLSGIPSSSVLPSSSLLQCPSDDPQCVIVDLGTPFVTDLLDGLPPSGYSTLLAEEQQGRPEGLMRVADGVATRLIGLPPLYFTFAVPTPATAAIAGVKREASGEGAVVGGGLPPPRVLYANEAPPQPPR